MRYAAQISYCGTNFCGWQIQPDQASVQGALEDSLSLLNGSHVQVDGAGRTDAGVHARAQVCSFDMGETWDERRLMLAANAHLPEGVSVMRTARVCDSFHARFSAVSREYCYFSWTGSSIYPHIKPYVCWLKHGRCDWKRAAAACRRLEGTHDFKNYCRTDNRPEDSVRTLHRVSLSRHGQLLRLYIKGGGFLTNMVRIIMGNLEQVALGLHDPEWIGELLESDCGRTSGGRTFPPSGLFLWRINYCPSPWTVTKAVK